MKCLFHRHHNEPESEVLRRIDVLTHKLDLFMEKIMATIAEVEAAVARNTDAENSVVTLGISQQLKDAKAAGDPAALDKVIAELDANTAKLAAAVTDNTPAA